MPGRRAERPGRRNYGGETDGILPPGHPNGSPPDCAESCERQAGMRRGERKDEKQEMERATESYGERSGRRNGVKRRREIWRKIRNGRQREGRQKERRGYGEREGAGGPAGRKEIGICLRPPFPSAKSYMKIRERYEGAMAERAGWRKIAGDMRRDMRGRRRIHS